MGFPLIKLGFLAVKQIAKPVGQRIKAYAVAGERFQRYMVAMGQFLHRRAIQVERASDGKEQLKTIAPLNEQRAIDRGADFVAECVVYSVSASVVAAEYFMCAYPPARHPSALPHGTHASRAAPPGPT